MLSEVINESSQSIVSTVTGPERSIALDTAALLGGREYLVQQVFIESQHMVYTCSERICLNWALGFLWNHTLLSSSEIEENFLRKDGGKFIQGPADLLSLVVGFNKSRITRIVSTCLLYCSRYEDTEVYQNPADPRHRILVINLRHFPYIEFPFGEIPTGTSSEKRIPCKRLAIVYVKISQSEPKHTASNKSKAQPRSSSKITKRPELQRKISFYGNVVSPTESEGPHEVPAKYRDLSHGLALEKDMLEKLHFVAMIPVP